MIIQHNLPALNAFRQGQANQTSLQKSLEKLSSGLRINRAGDDAAGLSISEKMRGQIRGLAQANRNIQDSISLVQTAEGGLQEIHSLLQRGRELMVQAANDTNSDEDRAAIQTEVNQVLEEVNRISSNTEFNGISLLGGQTVVPPVMGNFGGWPSEPAVDPSLVRELDPSWTLREKIAETLKWSMLEQSGERISTHYGIEGDNATMNVKFVNEPGDSYMAYVSYYINNTTQQGYGLNLVVNEAYFTEMNFPDGGTYPMYLDRVIAHEMVHATMASTMRFGEMPKWFKEGTAEFIHGGDERLAADLSYAGVDGVIAGMGNGTDSSWVNDSLHYSTGYVAVRYMHDKLKESGVADGIKALMEHLADNNSTLDQAINTVTSGSYGSLNAFVNDFKTNGKAYLQGMIDNGYLDPSNKDTGAIGGDDADNTGDIFDARNVIADKYEPKDQPLGSYGFTLNWPTGMESAAGAYNASANIQILSSTTLPVFQKLQFQTGANNRQGVELELYRADSAALQLSGVTAELNAESGIERFNRAIEQISSHRSYFGAMQNRLEHSLEITAQYHEQISTAESRIRDTDMAKEMMNLTKKNILSQAAQSMLAQANQIPQGVLQLLS